MFKKEQFKNSHGGRAICSGAAFDNNYINHTAVPVRSRATVSVNIVSHTFLPIYTVTINQDSVNTGEEKEFKESHGGWDIYGGVAVEGCYIFLVVVPARFNFDGENSRWTVIPIIYMAQKMYRTKEKTKKLRQRCLGFRQQQDRLLHQRDIQVSQTPSELDKT